jgi:DNA mismatch repair protein MutL
VSQQIHILPEALCNQIAAGEVVERPASVVKELVENSLDAGADRIQVEIENGGKRLIRITDNGCGMSREDAFLCLERHATSKLRAEQDLFRLTTLGFRGEALPSIAAVSRLALRTRRADALEGWEIIAEGGTVKRSSATGAPPGTCVEIRNLFFNTPARRKFLRRDETELGHIGETLTRLALSCPDVRLRFVHNGRLLWEVNRQKSLIERVAELLGRETVRDMIELDRQGAEGMHLHGLISRPGLSRAGLGGVYTFINGRFIRDRVVQHALADGYRNLLAKGRYPVLVLFLELDPSEVDVNVHPTKHEVRFRQQARVHDFIVQTLRDRLSASTPSVDRSRERGPFLMPDPAAPLPAALPDVARTAYRPVNGPAKFAGGKFPKEGGETAKSYSPAGEPPVFPTVQESPRPYTAAPESLSAPPARASDQASSLFGQKDQRCGKGAGEGSGFFGGMRVIGQYQNSYLVCQSASELILVDQHAAHERIGFEHLKQQYLSGSIERQLLLFPIILEFDFRRGRVVEEHADTMARLGFGLDPFGGNAFALKEIPHMLREADSERLVRDVVEELSDMGRSQSVEIELERVLLKMACHGMVRANQYLTLEEMKALLDELDETPFNTHCPHGRPTFVRWSLGEVERLFKRG